MLLFNKSDSATEFEVFVLSVATVLKEMKMAGMQETTMGEILVRLGKDEDTIDEDSWEQGIELEDILLELEVDRIAAGISARLH